MAIVNLIDTTFTAKNIATALTVYEYTVPGVGLWYHLYIQVRLYQVAGGGDYTINLRLNDGDVQADDPMVPKTVYTAAAGAQNLWFAGDVIANSGDVLNIICLGQSGDTAVVGSIRICYDDTIGTASYVTPPTAASIADAVLDEAGAGHIGLIPTNLDTTISSRLATSGYTVPPTAGAIADSVLDEAGSGHTGLLPTILDAAISTRLASAGYTTPPTTTEINTKLTTEHGSGLWSSTSGSGSILFTYNVTGPASVPISGATVRVATDLVGTNVIAEGTTDNFGNVQFYLDAGTYYFFTTKSGYVFANPDTEIVS